MKIIEAVLHDKNAATAIERGQPAPGISPAIIAAVNGFGSKPNTNFSSINRSLA